MKRVAEKLEAIAGAAVADEDVNFFGRSSFNRYYYSIFLQVRDVLRAKNPDWGRIAHKTVPEVLKGAVLKEIRKAVEAQVKASLLSKSEGAAMAARANGVVNELSDLLAEAYQVRCDADYEPEHLALRSNGSIVMREKKLSAAATWPRRADAKLGELLRIWRDLGFTV